jgi:hypothetical protein
MSDYIFKKEEKTYSLLKLLGLLFLQSVDSDQEILHFCPPLLRQGLLGQTGAPSDVTLGRGELSSAPRFLPNDMELIVYIVECSFLEVTPFVGLGTTEALVMILRVTDHDA